MPVVWPFYKDTSPYPSKAALVLGRYSLWRRRRRRQIFVSTCSAERWEILFRGKIATIFNLDHLKIIPLFEVIVWKLRPQRTHTCWPQFTIDFRIWRVISLTDFSKLMSKHSGTRLNVCLLQKVAVSSLRLVSHLLPIHESYSCLGPIRKNQNPLSKQHITVTKKCPLNTAVFCLVISDVSRYVTNCY